MPSPDHASLVALLERDRVLGIIRAGSVDAALSLGRRALREGLGVVEVSLTTSGWDRVIRTLRSEFAEAWVGAGTVLNLAQARDALAAGAQFLVSPGLPEDLELIVGLGAPLFPGVFSPSEIMAAVRAGVRGVKLFPAHVGGPGLVRSLHGPFPGLTVIAVGGIGPEEVPTWIEAGALAVGLGSELGTWIEGRGHHAG